MEFSEQLAARATRATNGELAFTRDDVPRAIRELREARRAILGGEVWLASAAGPSLIRTATGELGVYSWTAPDRAPGEAWESFVERTCADAESAIRGLLPEADLNVAEQAHVRFNLTYVDEREHAGLATSARRPWWRR